MIFREFGKEGEKTVLLIHGLGCNAEKSFAIPSAILSRTYRVITVDLDGYDGNGSVFTTIILKGRLPEMKIICTGNYGHGELMFTDPQRYTELIAKEMRKI